MQGVHRFLQGHAVIGEVCVVAGSLSNLLIDGNYHGVIDFIEFSYRGYTWPVFILQTRVL